MANNTENPDFTPIDDEVLRLQIQLHHSDAPSLKLSTTLLNNTNYSRWRRAVEVSLSAKNKLGFVNGTCLRPESDPKMAAKWDQCNSMLISWQLHSMEKEIGEYVLFCQEASQIWNELALQFGKSNRTNLYQIQKELALISQGNQSITTYFTNLKKIWDEYALALTNQVCKCGSNSVATAMIHDQQIVQFLVGLNESFNLARSHILMMHPSPNLNEVYKILLQEESRRSLSNPSVLDNNATAMYAHNRTNSFKTSNQGQSLNSSSRPYCDHCKTKGHIAEKCWKVIGYPTSPVPGLAWCTQCKIAGHDTNKCWKKIGYPAGHKLANTSINNSFTTEQMNSILALLEKNTTHGSTSNSTAFLAGPFDEDSDGDWTSI